MTTNKMTNKQIRFCEEYLIDLNATQAAIRAGYSEKTAGVMGSENLEKPYIRAYIDEQMEAKNKELIASQDEVLRYLTSVLRGESQSAELVVEGTGQGMSEAKIVYKEPTEKDRLKAGELLGKRYGLFTEKVEADVDTTLTINIDYGDDEADED